MSAAAPARAKYQAAPAANVCTDEYAGTERILRRLVVFLVVCMVGEALWFLATNVMEGML